MTDLVKFGTWYHVKNHYRVPDGTAPDGLFLDVLGPSANHFLDVSASVQKDRIGQGTGLWKLVPALESSIKKDGDPVVIGDKFYLKNYFGPESYLDIGAELTGGQNKHDVVTSTVKAAAGTGSKRTIWSVTSKEEGVRMTGVAVEEGRTLVGIMSEEFHEYLDTCGAGKGSPHNRNDVSTSLSEDRDQGSGTWSFIPYDKTCYEREVMKEPCVAPNTLVIENIQCIVPSSGIASAPVFGTAAAIIGGAVTAVVMAPVTLAAIAASAGVATPIAGAMYVGFLSAATAISSAAGLATQKVAQQVGTTMPDQTYISVNDNKVWPDDASFRSMNMGDSHSLNYTCVRDPGASIRIKICEHDIILSDDVLATIDILPGTEYVHAQIPCINEAEGSAYLIQITATCARTSHEILLEDHEKIMHRLP